MLNIDVKSHVERTESNPIIPAKRNDISFEINPHLMNADTNKMGGRKNDTTNEYPGIFLFSEWTIASLIPPGIRVRFLKAP